MGRVLRMFGGLAGCALVLAAVPSMKISTHASQASSQNNSQTADSNLWKQIQPGAAWQGIQVDRQKRVWLANGDTKTLLFTVPGDEESSTLGVSPPDPTGRFLFVVAEGVDINRGWIVDKTAGRATRLELPDGVDDFSAWSPDGKYVVLHTSLYEGPEQLWVLEAANLHFRKVHRTELKAGVKSCCGLDDWAKGKGEQSKVDEETVQWQDAKAFSFRLWTRCNPSENAECDAERELSAYIVTVNIESGKVSERRVAARSR
jgi:dipeptidyl aminopeptidase/acylaminoacyl peptidase